MIEAFLWGALAASALLVGALVAYAVTPSQKLIAVVMALGAGLLIGSIAFELIDEALKTSEVATVGAYTLVGAAAFTLGNWWLDRRGGGDRKDSDGAQAEGSPRARRCEPRSPRRSSRAAPTRSGSQASTTSAAGRTSAPG